MKFLLILLLLPLTLHAKLAFEDPDLASERKEEIVTQEECTDVDIRETNPSIRDNPEMKKFFYTPRDQDSIGWCYAFAAADLLSAEVGRPVSGMHVSLMMNKRYQQDPDWQKFLTENKGKYDASFETVYDIGFIDKTFLETVQAGKVCPEELLPFDSKYKTETYNFIKMLEQDKKLERGSEDIICQEIKIYLPDFNSSQEDLRSLAKKLATQNLNLSLEELASTRCQGKMIEVPKDIKMFSIDVPKVDLSATMKQVNSVLDKGHPLGISYQVDAVSDTIKGGHANTIIGRRWKYGQCQYLVRNSWGKSCASYKKEIECDKEQGTFWMPDDVFKNSVKAINYVSH